MANEAVSMDIAGLVADHHQAVYTYAYRLAGSVPEAEDLTQQVFLVAQQKLGQLRKAGSARSWLFTILRNHFVIPQDVAAGFLNPVDGDVLPRRLAGRGSKPAANQQDQ